MATAEKLPFSWRDVESPPDLERLRLVLETLPDGEIVAALEAGRGRGRNDYPVRAMWRALIAGIVFQHVSIQSLLRKRCERTTLILSLTPGRSSRAGVRGSGIADDRRRFSSVCS